MEDLLIFPCNGNALEALDCLGNQYKCIGFVDDNLDKIGTQVLGIPVYGRNVLLEKIKAKVLAVPGSPTTFQKRKKIIDGLEVPNERFATVIHPRANVSKFASVGLNVLIYAGVVVTATSSIGNHVCVLPNSIVHHDSQVGDYTLVGASCAIAGYVRIGENCYVGSKSSVRNNLTVGAKALIGMGSNVIFDIPEGAVVYGNPAKLKS